MLLSLHPDWRRIRRAGLIVSIGILLLLPVWIVRYPPLVDYPNHLARYFILAHLKDPNLHLAELYESKWGPYPYVALDLLGVALQRLMPIYVVGIGYDATHAGILFGLQSVTSFVSRPTMGWASDRIGRRPLILLNHLDTVRADSSQWKVPPLEGRIVDGELYGRGTLDMKGLGLLQAMTMLVAAREHLPLHRARGN